MNAVGEAAPLVGFSNETLEDAQHELMSITEDLPGNDFSNEREKLFLELRRYKALSSSVKFCLESAIFELASRTSNKPLSLWLNPSAKDYVPVNAILSGDFNHMKDIISSYLRAGYNCFKIKITESNIQGLSAFLGEFNSLTAGSINFRLDFNQLLSLNQAKEFLQGLSIFPIEYIEEPISEPDPMSLSILRSETGIPIALDESIGKEFGCNQIIEEDLADVYILKPTVHGGIIKLFKLYHEMSSKNKKVVLTSALESQVGLKAVANLAAACSGISEVPACGLSTLSLFKNFDSEVSKWFEEGSIIISRLGI